MPELHEVETIKNDLLPHVVGRRFVEIKLASPEVVKTPSGRGISNLRQRGNYLIFNLEGGLAN